ncbi:hypothetical protein T484DRAFT_2159278 [Baffinella frigidus]|nr:hypothetical protein T484DRAFT_2159278 [Cryptophyta sp. CCMP2293]
MRPPLRIAWLRLSARGAGLRPPLRIRLLILTSRGAGACVVLLGPPRCKEPQFVLHRLSVRCLSPVGTARRAPCTNPIPDRLVKAPSRPRIPRAREAHPVGPAGPRSTISPRPAVTHAEPARQPAGASQGPWRPTSPTTRTSASPTPRRPSTAGSLRTRSEEATWGSLRAAQEGEHVSAPPRGRASMPLHHCEPRTSALISSWVLPGEERAAAEARGHVRRAHPKHTASPER